MKRYRAVKVADHDKWCVEEFDTEFQVSSYVVDSEGKRRYFDFQKYAEIFIKEVLIPFRKDKYGPWIDGTV
jgi:hypothetical protein